MKNIFRIIVLLGFVMFYPPSDVFCQVAVNTDGGSPDPSAGLDVKFSDKGFLPPRVELTAIDAASPVVAPANGLIVYNTASAGEAPGNVVPGYYYWEGGRWTRLVTGTGTAGQTLRNIGGSWVASSLLYNDGSKIGIGTTVPTHQLTVEGSSQTARLVGPGNFGSTARLNFGDENYVYISEDDDDKLLIYANSRTSVMGGNVGIGTTAPANRLTVAGTIQTTSGGLMYPDGTIQTSASADNIHAIGESYGGGIVFYVYDGGQHGLIAAPSDQNTSIQWYNGSNTVTNAVRDGVFAGQMNTERIIANQGPGNYAAQICSNYKGGGFGDWYLPSADELGPALYLQKAVVGGFLNDYYWSSTESSDIYVYERNFTNGNIAIGTKNSFDPVRAIRAF